MDGITQYLLTKDVFNLKSIVPPSTTPLVPGSNPVPLAGFVFETGLLTTTTSASGIISVNFPQSFANGVLFAIAQVVGVDAWADLIVPLATFQSVNQINFQISNAAGTVNSTSVTINWLAIGW